MNEARSWRVGRGTASGRARRMYWFAGVMLLLLTPHAFALEFDPTEFEWSTWPDYCRARYMVSGAGQKSRFAGKIPASEVENWKHKLDPVWYGLHHYCAAIHLFTRAQHQKKRIFAEHDFRRVAGETGFTLARSSPTHPLYATMLTLRGRANFELGLMKDAQQDFARAAQLHPDVGDSYAAWALLLRRTGHRPEARDVLERGIKGTKGGTAELHYLLGIILTEMQDYTPALEHAKLAYKMGYPLLGLKRKLQKSGHWTD